MSKHILGILCSGRGSNMQSIMAAIKSGQIKAEIGIVLTDKPEARALQVASEAGIKSVCVNRKACASQQEFEENKFRNPLEPLRPDPPLRERFREGDDKRSSQHFTAQNT